MTVNAVPVNKIIPISTVDGVGSRTSIFLQGCNIHCLYCHNPETINLCNNCGICVDHCPPGALSMKKGKVLWDDEICISCDNCIEICPYFSTPKIKYLTPDAVLEKVARNIPFIRGITVSGGEATLYPEFLKELFTKAKAKYNLHCLLDSNGMVDFSKHMSLVDVIDGVMLDVKAWKKDVYKELVNADSNDNVKKNIAFLSIHNKLEEIRIVCIDELVDVKDVLLGISQILLDKTPTTKLKLIRFRNNGVKGPLAKTKSPNTKTMEDLKKYAQKLNFKNIIIL